MLHKMKTRLKHYSGKPFPKPSKTKVGNIYLGVVNHCQEMDKKKSMHWHFFWDMDSAIFSDVRFAAEILVEEFKCDILIVQSGPFGYHLVCPQPMNRKTVERMEKRVCDSLEADYIATNAADEISGASGATLRISEKHGMNPSVTAIIPCEKRGLNLCYGLMAIYGLRHHPMQKIVGRYGLWARPTLSLYRSKGG